MQGSAVEEIGSTDDIRDPLIGVVSDANHGHAEEAIQAAAAAFPMWSRVAPETRARVLFRAAAIMRRRLYELSAWECFEESKSWIEAYADVCEAIDFLDFYGREAIRLGGPHPVTPIPGEDGEVRYIPLGVRAANASLRQVDHSLEESAQILGAKWLTTMREITLPLIRPGLFAGWLLVFVPVIQELSASILLFSSQSITLAVAVYNLYETGYIEPVAALAMVNMAIIGLAIWLANRLGGAPPAARGEAAPVGT